MDDLSIFGFDDEPQQLTIPPPAGTMFRDAIGGLFVAQGDGRYRYGVEGHVVDPSGLPELFPVDAPGDNSNAVPPDHNDYWRLVARVRDELKMQWDSAQHYVHQLLQWTGVTIGGTTDIPLFDGFTWAVYEQIREAIETAATLDTQPVVTEDVFEVAPLEEVSPETEIVANEIQLPATRPVQDVDEFGEVVPIIECLRIAGHVVDEEQPLFEICDDASLEWFIGLIRRLQHEIEDISQSAVKMIQQRVNAIGGLLFYYSPQLRAVSYATIKRDKNGKLKSKNVRTMRGGLYWKVLGGVKCLDKKIAIEWIQQHVPEHEWESYGLHWAKPRLELTVTKAYKKWTDDHIQIGGLHEYQLQELGIPSVGSADKAWSFNTIRTLFKEAVKAISLRGESGDDTPEENE